MKAFSSVFALLLCIFCLLLAVPLAVADTWTCPVCGNSNTTKFCPIDGTASPSPAPAPTPAPVIQNTNLPRYENAKDLLITQPYLKDVELGSTSVTATFDQPLLPDSSVNLNYYDASGEMQSVHLKAESGVKTYTFPVTSGWKQNDYASIEVISYAFDEGLAVFRFRSGDCYADYLALSYVKYSNMPEFPSKPEVYASFIDNSLLESISYNGESLNYLGLVKNDASGNREAVIFAVDTGEVSWVELYRNNSITETLFAPESDLSSYQAYVNANMPVWRSGGPIVIPPAATPVPARTPVPTPFTTPTPVPETLEINNTVAVHNGHVTVSWKDAADNSPYTVAYEYADGGTAIQTSYWASSDRAGSTTYSKEFTLDNLIPGRQYIIKVTDSNNHMATRTIRVPAAPAFTDGRLTSSSLKVSTAFRYKQSEYVADKNATKISSLNAREMVSNMNSYGYEYGIRYRIDIPRLAYSRDYDVMLAFIAPNGYAFCFYDTVTFSSFNGASSSWYEWYCIGDFFFNKMLEKNGTIPSGTYTVELYLNGMQANITTFRVQ